MSFHGNVCHPLVCGYLNFLCVAMTSVLFLGAQAVYADTSLKVVALANGKFLHSKGSIVSKQREKNFIL